MEQSIKVGKKTKLFFKVIFGCVVIGILTIACLYIVSFFLGPPDLTTEQNTIYYGADGKIIGEERGELGNRYWVTLDEISPFVIDAVIAVEDQHFYEHNGFDFKRIARAVYQNIRHFSLREGASTLSQQYARNLYLTHEKTWHRKGLEAFYTIRLEMFYSKDEILEGYLNTIYFGHGAYGIEAASRFFFDKQAKDLTLEEAAMLVGIPRGPNYYSPLNDYPRAKERQQHILTLLKDEGKISDEAYASAVNAPLAFQEKPGIYKENIAPYFQDVVLNEAASLLGVDRESVQSGGYDIYTTLRTDLQSVLESAIKDDMASTEIEIGAMAIDPHTGAIRSLVGGRNYEQSSFNRAIHAKRMAGSTFKPFLYYAALEYNYTPSTMLNSQPTVFQLDDNETYAPRNYNGYYAYKPITLAQSLALSDNIYAVKTNLFLGTEQLIETAEKFGIESDLPNVPSLALGSASVSVEEMVRAYGMLANGGYELEPYTIEKIVDQNGKVLYEHEETERTQVLDPVHTFLLTHLMTGMFDPSLNGYMEVTGASMAPDLNRTYAGKSGSTHADSWMIGFSPSLVTGIWTGYDDHRRIERVSDMNHAKNIWAHFMEQAHDGQVVENFDIPSGVVGMEIDPSTGQIATPYCQTSRLMYFKKGTEPKVHCTAHYHEEAPIIDQPRENANEEKGFLERLFDWFR